MYDIAAEVGCSDASVYLALKKHKIPTRPNTERVHGLRDKQCRRCGETFTPTGPAALFCSEACRVNDRACFECKTPFPSTAPKWRYGTYRFCSQDCREKFRAQRGKGRGAFVNKDGYRLIRVPVTRPGAYSSGYMPEHRYVMEQHLGRSLLPGENVHHINGVKTDNRIENLELWISKQPKGQRVEDVVAWSLEMLSRYRPDLLSKGTS